MSAENKSITDKKVEKQTEIAQPIEDLYGEVFYDRKPEDLVKSEKKPEPFNFYIYDNQLV